jgi:hypothetical protein
MLIFAEKVDRGLVNLWISLPIRQVSSGGRILRGKEKLRVCQVAREAMEAFVLCRGEVSAESVGGQGAVVNGPVAWVKELRILIPVTEISLN